MGKWDKQNNLPAGRASIPYLCYGKASPPDEWIFPSTPQRSGFLRFL